MNARFWIWWNSSWVKLTLSPGQEVTMQTGGPTDEGFHWEAVTYTFDGETVISDMSIQSRDCDGRFDSQSEYHCNVENLHAVGEDGYRPDRPQWERGRCSVYDQYAQLAGY